MVAGDLIPGALGTGSGHRHRAAIRWFHHRLHSATPSGYFPFSLPRKGVLLPQELAESHLLLLPSALVDLPPRVQFTRRDTYHRVVGKQESHRAVLWIPLPQ